MILSAIVAAQFAVSYLTYRFEGIVRESTVVVFGNYRGIEGEWTNPPYIEQYEVISGKISGARNLVKVPIEFLPNSSAPRFGWGLYFLVQCGSRFVVAGHGQGAYSLVGESFVVPVSESEVAKPMTKKDVAKAIDVMNLLGTESVGVCEALVGR